MPDTTAHTAVDGISHALAVAIVETLQAIAAKLTPEAVQRAAEAHAVAKGQGAPQEAARIALCGCLEAVEAIRRQMPTAATESEGGEA